MTIEEMKQYTSEEKRELGKALLFNDETTCEQKDDGMQLLLRACVEGDADAMFVIGLLYLDGVLKVSGGDGTNRGVDLICKAARRKHPSARAFLNKYCQSRYAEKFDNVKNPNAVEGKLVDFDGKTIRINRKGLFTPVDAVLEYRDGQNVLTLSTDVVIGDLDGIDMSVVDQAVVDGIKEWAGDYVVFGGQKLRVDVNVTLNNNMFDNIVVLPMTKGVENLAKRIAEISPNKTKGEYVKNIYAQRRSFMGAFSRWTVHSRKFIMLYSGDNSFTDYERMRSTVKHEFGHVIGLGDLYYSPSDELQGVENGKYSELDSYAVGQKMYNLVMCDGDGPISNNDVEMVILAFKNNKAQNFQPSKYKGEISEALGRGN